MTDAIDHYADAGFDAVRYDAIHAGQTRDVAFYVGEASRACGPVLEVGCGTGRVTFPIATAGVPVTGLDLSAPMLEIAARKKRGAPPAIRERIDFVRADARAFAFRQRFSRVFAPFRSLQAFLTVHDQLAALRSARDVLGPEGRLVFDIFTPDPESVAAASETASPLEETGRSFVDGRVETVERASVGFDPAGQVAELEYAYERWDDGGGLLDRSFETFRIRWFHRYELEHLLARAGFAVETVWSGWERGPLGGVGEDEVWVARPA